MGKLIIEGGRPLFGEVRVSGAKNAALPLMAACLLTDEEIVLSGCPRIRDVADMSEALQQLGVHIEENEGNLTLKGTHIACSKVSGPGAGRIRSSIFALGPALARCGEADFALPGGCRIGARPIDQHLYALRMLGARVWEEEGRVRCRATHLCGARIAFSCPSVGATENAMLAAAAARGESVIENAAREPEIGQLQSLLNRMGARVEGAGTSVIRIQGQSRLLGARHKLMGDRIEAATFLAGCGAAGGKIRVLGADPKHLEAVLEVLRNMGALVRLDGTTIEMEMEGRPQAFSFKTAPYPGFPTDAQAPFCAAAAVARGASVLYETVFDNRLGHLKEMERAGCVSETECGKAVISGVGSLQGATMTARDLRGGAALVLTALAARGESQILQTEYIERGYENLEGKLRGLGAQIRKEEM